MSNQPKADDINHDIIKYLQEVEKDYMQSGIMNVIDPHIVRLQQRIDSLQSRVADNDKRGDDWRNIAEQWKEENSVLQSGINKLESRQMEHDSISIDSADLITLLESRVAELEKSLIYEATVKGKVKSLEASLSEITAERDELVKVVDRLADKTTMSYSETVLYSDKLELNTRAEYARTRGKHE